MSSNEGVVTEKGGEEIRGSGEFGIWRVQLKRDINPLLIIRWFLNMASFPPCLAKVIVWIMLRQRISFLI